MWVLTATGALFNWLVNNFIVGFSGWYDTIQRPVELAWSAFRDIANILIIGMFTFIALSTIVGLQQFNAKKLLARVLIIAVLINFSLLFAKIIIDTSNFAALQVYNAAALPGGGTSTAAADAVAAPSSSASATAGSGSGGIAGQFIDLLGIKSLGNTYSSLNNIAQATDNGWIALIHGILVLIITLGTAFVLLYGAFLIISRTVMLIFLMMTASVAFASHLIPYWSSSRFGWEKWWNTLIKCAAFAPIIMLLLWMTLSVSYNIHANAKGSFGDMLANPSSAPDLSTLANYLIILGLLFVSFKLSSIFSEKIAGFDIAAMATALPLTLGSRAAALALRYAPGLGGRGSMRRALDLDDQIDGKKESLRKETDAGKRMQLVNDIASLTRSKRRAEGRAESSYNIMNTGAARAVAAGLGITGFAAGADKKLPSYAATAKAQADKAAKEAAGLSLSQEDKNNIREESRRHFQERRQDRALKKKEHEENLKKLEEVAKAEKQPLQAQKEQSQGVKSEINNKYDSEQKALLRQIAEAAEGSDTRRNLETQYQQSRAARQGALDREEEKITAIDQQLKAVDTRVGITSKQAEIDAIDEELKEMTDAKIREKANKAVTDAADTRRSEAAQIGARLSQGQLTTLVQRAIGINPENTVPARMAFKQTKKKINVKGAAAGLQAIRDEAQSAGEATDQTNGGATGGGIT